MLDRLRAETRAEHTAIEGALGLMREELTLTDYQRLLEQYYALYAPIEAMLACVPLQPRRCPGKARPTASRGTASRSPTAINRLARDPAFGRPAQTFRTRGRACMLAELLSIYRHETRVANSGLVALAMVREFRPALVILDMGMPAMNGYETAKRIRADDPAGSVTLVALTGWGAEADQIKARDAGFDHHFTMPVELAKVDSLLQLVALRQASKSVDHADVAATAEPADAPQPGR